jgi:hypothetical protein
MLVSSSIARQFLQCILPSEGPYVAWIKFADGRSFNAFAHTVADLWQVLQRYDQRGASVYHACARFKEAKLDPKGLPLRERRFGRTNHNVAELKALFLDVDAGPSEANKPPKPYRDGREAADATLEFCRLAQLPIPVFVASGNGLHAYWPLANPMAPEEWQRYARGLRSLCNKFGLKADPARTTDVCSVLRTPGTHNRKDGLTKEVKCAGLYGPYPVESFETLAKCEEAQRPKKSILARLGPKPAYLRNCPTKALEIPKMEPPPASAVTIADRCAQVRALRDVRGNLPEPLWYAALAVISRCTDGDAKAHEWSSGYDGYSEAETQERLDRSRCLTGATRCARFRALNPKGCRRCVWSEKITSPIQLGWPR